MQIGFAVDCYVWSEFEKYMLKTHVLRPHSVNNITFLRSSSYPKVESTESMLTTLDFFLFMAASMLGLITLMCSFK